MFTKEINNKSFTVPEVKDLLAATDLGTDHTVEDWPYGRQKRCSMRFYVEHKGRFGERLVKQSTFNGRVNKPKPGTYATKVKLILIDDRIAHVRWSKDYGMLEVSIEDGKYLGQTFYSDEAIELAWHFFKI